jgi:hypothetical protein
LFWSLPTSECQDWFVSGSWHPPFFKQLIVLVGIYLSFLGVLASPTPVHLSWESHYLWRLAKDIDISE